MTATATCAICLQPINRNRQDEWRHGVSGVWANQPVQHQATPALAMTRSR